MTRNTYKHKISAIRESVKSVNQKKGHGGELKLETSEREGTTFIIVLPITS